MANGQQIAERNFQSFSAWIASKSEGEFRALAIRGVLSRTEIAVECGFAKSALVQNPRIKSRLQELEDQLREQGVLPPRVEKLVEEGSAPLLREPGKLRGVVVAERLRRLETDNALLRAEVTELKSALEKHAIVSEALAMTGRVLR